MSDSKGTGPRESAAQRAADAKAIGLRLGREAYDARRDASSITFREPPIGWTTYDHYCAQQGFYDGYDVSALMDPARVLTVADLDWWPAG